MFMLRKLKAAGLNSQELLIVYKRYIRPLLEYGAPLWPPGLTKQQFGQVENIQKRVCKYILGRNYKSNTESLATLEMKTLHDRRVDISRDFLARYLLLIDSQLGLLPLFRIPSCNSGEVMLLDHSGTRLSGSNLAPSHTWPTCSIHDLF